LVHTGNISHTEKELSKIIKLGKKEENTKKNEKDSKEKIIKRKFLKLNKNKKSLLSIEWN